MNSSVGGKILNGVIACFAVALLVANVILLRQNRQLKASPESLNAFVVHRDRPLKNIGGVGLDGRFHMVSLPVSSADHLLLFTFAPGCPECQLQEPLIATVSREAKKRGWRTVWISSGGVEDTRAYCEASEIPVEETLIEPPHWTYLSLGMEVVPQLVAVGEKGKVEEVWMGRITEKTAASISQFMASHSNSSGGAPGAPSGPTARAGDMNFE
jgi:hypothetical protein